MEVHCPDGKLKSVFANCRYEMPARYWQLSIRGVSVIAFTSSSSLKFFLQSPGTHERELQEKFEKIINATSTVKLGNILPGIQKKTLYVEKSILVLKSQLSDSIIHFWSQSVCFQSKTLFGLISDQKMINWTKKDLLGPLSCKLSLYTRVSVSGQMSGCITTESGRQALRSRWRA